MEERVLFLRAGAPPFLAESGLPTALMGRPSAAYAGDFRASHFRRPR